MSKVELNGNIGELVRKMESDYTKGNVTISEYVTFDMYDTINTIEAYLNSKHIHGEQDSLGRDKPFFNISVSAANIWYRATDIDRKNIKIKAAKSKDTINAFLATIHLQDWMRKAKFGQFLNEWGRVLARYGSAPVKFIENSEGLHSIVVPWNRLICDPIDFDNNAKIEVLELTEAQLRKEKKYDKEMVKQLISARKSRETLDKRKKDSKSEYIKLYEIHGEFPLSFITGKDEDADEYTQQMHVISFVGIRNGRKTDYQDFTLYSGRETKDPYMITHLIKEDGRTLSIGAVEHLFQSQWMVNHSAKAIKDQLDLASKLVFQTSDSTFIGQNVLTSIETGDIFIHAPNQPLAQLNNQSHDTVSLQNFNQMWKSLGNEITGISESMLGVAPKSGTAWRQTEALLQESYSLFELMTENKALHIEDFLRVHIIPHIKKKMDTADEITATLEGYDINWIDEKYIKNTAKKKVKQAIKDRLKSRQKTTPEEALTLEVQFEEETKQGLKEQGNQRFFKPSEIKGKTWKKQLENLEWELEVDITGENKDYQAVLSTLNTALQVIVAPGFEQNQRAQLVVDEILRSAGHLSPLQLSSLRSTVSPIMPVGGSGAGNAGDMLKNLQTSHHKHEKGKKA